MDCRKSLALLVVVLFSSGTVQAENWPAWRGPRGDGLSIETDLPVQWSSEENVVWKTLIPGRGHSSPIIWDDMVFVTSCVEEKDTRTLTRLDRVSGKIVWEKQVLVSPLEKIHKLNSYASATPATDGKRVFMCFLEQKEMFVAAYDIDGNKLWEQRPGPFSSVHGFCTNPVLYQDKLLLNGDHDGEAYLTLLEQATGKVVWKTARTNKLRSYGTPLITTIDGKDVFLLTGSLCTAAYDIATGEQIWKCDGPSEQMVATMSRGHGLIFAAGGFPERHLLAIREGGTGDITKSHIVWRTHKGIPYVPSPLLYGDYLHVVADEGIYTCFNPLTGDVYTNKRAAKHVSSSPVGGAERVYISDDIGTTKVIKNGPKFDIVATNSLGEDIYSTLAFSQGSVFIRGDKHLFRIGKPGSNPPAVQRIPPPTTTVQANVKSDPK